MLNKIDIKDLDKAMAHGFSNNDMSSALNIILDSYIFDDDTRRQCIECAEMLQLLSRKRDFTSDMTCGFCNNLSSVLDMILDSYGLDEDTRRKLIECRKMEQLFFSWKEDLTAGGTPTFFSGSFYEVTTVKGLSSDIDVMRVIPAIRVIDDISQWKPDKSVATFMMDSDGCYKAFYKLYQLSDDYPGPLYQDVAKFREPFLQNDDNGRIMFRSDAIFFHLPYKTEKHGPAQSMPADYLVPEDFDNVPCLMCDSFPQAASNWKQRQTSLTRSRVGGAIIDQATHCYLVGVGNKGSVTEHLEWRLSFSHIENQLIHAWNNTVNKCYIMMKFIKKDLIEPVVPALLCSYHFKTILMWMNEEYDIFVPSNFENCLVTCLRNVLLSVKKRSLPHYFVGGCNLFINKINEETRDLLVSVLENILETWPYSLFQLKRRNLGYILQQSLYLGIVNDSLCDILRQESENATDVFSLNGSIYLLYHNLSISKVTSQMTTSNEILPSLINLVNRSKRVSWHYQEESREFIAFMLKDALCQFGLSLIRRSRGMPNKQMYYDRKSGSALVRRYINSCSIHTTIRIAEHFTVSENHLWALKLLEIAERKIDIEGNLMRRRSTEVNLFRRYRPEAFIDFTEDIITYLPRGLAYELITVRAITDLDTRHKHSIVLHGPMYMHYLQFICFNALGLHAHRKVALDNMIWFSKKEYPYWVQRCNYNIIGQCYSVLGEARKAYREYRKSMVAQRNHNAALWHLAVLLRNRIQNSQR